MITQHRKRLSTAAGQQAGLPRPLHSVLPYLAIGGLAGVLGASGALRATAWTAVLIASLAGGTGALAWAWIRRRQLSVCADAWLTHERGHRPSPGVLRDRTHTLLAPRHRRMVAGSLRRVACEPERSSGPSARVPLDLSAVRACQPQLVRAAADLEDVSQPVSARAVVLAEELITDPGSPIYRHAHSGAQALEERLRQTLFELERSF